MEPQRQVLKPPARILIGAVVSAVAVVSVVALVLAVAACGGIEGGIEGGGIDGEAASGEAAKPTIEYGERFPEVIAAEARLEGGDTWRFDVTLSSPYDTRDRYADAWRVLDADDRELGIRVLLHDHAGEQPFTRSASIDVPAGTTTVWIEGRDQANGWSGQRYELSLGP